MNPIFFGERRLRLYREGAGGGARLFRVLPKDPGLGGHRFGNDLLEYLDFACKIIELSQALIPDITYTHARCGCSGLRTLTFLPLCAPPLITSR